MAAGGFGFSAPAPQAYTGTQQGQAQAFGGQQAQQQGQQQFGFNTQLQQQGIQGQKDISGQAQTAQMNQLQAQLASQQGIATQAQSSETQRANIAAQAQEYAPTLKQQDFQQLFPLLASVTGSVQNLAGAPATTGPSAGAAGGGPISPGFGSQPPGGGPTAIGAMQGSSNPALTPLQQAGVLQPGNPIAANPVLNPQQIQQQVNQSRAATDASAANQERNQSAQLAGRGFGANSPLAALLNSGTQMNALTANSANENALRYNAAQGNASQLLNAQQAQSQQNLGAQAAASARQAPIYGQTNALIAALSNLG